MSNNAKKTAGRDGKGEVVHPGVEGRVEEGQTQQDPGSKEEFEKMLKKAMETKCKCKRGKAKSIEYAVQNGCLRCCADHIEEAKECDKSSLYSSPLIEATEAGNVELVKLLLYYQKDFADDRGRKAADFARNENSPELWRLFPEDITEDDIVQLERAHAMACTCGGQSKDIAEAAQNVCLGCYKTYLREEKDQAEDDENSHGEYFSRNLMMKAANRGHIEIARLLMCKEAKMQDEYGNTALMLAALENSAEAARLLLPHEAGMRDFSEKTALMLAAEKGNVEVARLLIPLEAKLETNNSETALRIAAENGSLEIVRLLAPLEAGMQEPGYWTALICAAQNGHAECVRLLLPYEAGAKDSQGWTAACYATVYLQRECAALLMAEEKETEGIPAQMVAAFRGDARTMLQMRGKWTETLKNKTQDNLTILHFAFAGRSQRCMRVLLREEEMLEFFAKRSFEFRRTRGDPVQEIRGMLQVLVRQDDSYRLFHIISLLSEGNARSARALMLVTMLVPNRTLKELLERSSSKEGGVRLLRLAKNVGFVFSFGFDEDDYNRLNQHYHYTVLDLLTWFKEKDVEFIHQSPILAKQIELAKSQAERADGVLKALGVDGYELDYEEWQEEDIQKLDARIAKLELLPEKQFAYREVRSEVAFASQILLESRDVCWKAISSPRAVLDASPNAIKRKLNRGRQLLWGSVRFVKNELRKMMNE